MATRGIGRAGRYFQHALASDFWPRRGRKHNNASEPRNTHTCFVYPIVARANRFNRPRYSRVQTLIPVRQLALAHDAPLLRQPAPVHTVVIAVVPLRFRQPFVQPQKSLPTAVANLKVLAPPAVRQLNHRRPDPHFLPLLAAPCPLISPHLVKRYGRHDTPSLALHGHPGPNPQRPPDFF